MPIKTESVSQQEPVRFRVTAVGPHPRPMHRSDELMLTIDYVNKGGGINFGMRLDSYFPYRNAVEEAMKTGAVYWVDWDYSKTTGFPPHPDDTTLDRLLKALQNRQIVPNPDDEEAEVNGV